MSILIVPDTHIFISGATLSSSYTGQIMRAWRTDEIEIATSEQILAEVRRVWNYPEVSRLYNWSDEQIEAFIADTREAAVVVTSTAPLTVSADPDDNKFFECAVAAGADYIVSKDKHVLEVGEYRGIQTVKPGYFVEQVLKERRFYEQATSKKVA